MSIAHVLEFDDLRYSDTGFMQIDSKFTKISGKEYIQLPYTQQFVCV